MGSSTPSVALSIRKLGLTISGHTILQDVSIDISQGSFVGVIGPNGAGKTTLFNAISGLAKPTSGTIHMNGKEITSASVVTRARSGLGRTFQTSTLFPQLTVWENVRLAAQSTMGHEYSLFRFPRKKDQASVRTQKALEAVGLTHHADKAAGDISHGDKRKLEIAVLQVTDVDVVLLDEPMAGVGSGDVAGLTAQIKKMHLEKRCTTLMVEHHLDVLLGLVDKVAVMHFGHIIAFDSPQQIMNNPIVQSAYLGK